MPIFDIVVCAIWFGFWSTFFLPKRMFMNDIVPWIFVSAFSIIPLVILVPEYIANMRSFISGDDIDSMVEIYTYRFFMGLYVVFPALDIFERIGEINPRFKRK